MTPDRTPATVAARALPWLGAMLAAVAIALHSPGHVSMDTSVQLYEAYIGRSVSWNPAFMSALMRWLGGGELATALLVFAASAFTYLGLSAVAADSLRQGALERGRGVGWARVLGCALLLLNPVVFLYVGIVWKDVLFSAMLTAASALALVAANAPVRRAIALGALSTVLLALSMQVRQQGVFMAPVMMLLPLVAIAGDRAWTSRRKALAAAGLAALFLLTVVSSKALVAASIQDAGDRSSSVGFRSIMSFDIAGTVARSDTATADLPVPISEDQRAAVRRVYSSQRIDFLASDATASAWVGGMTDQQRKQAWQALASGETGAFLEHKWVSFRTLLDLNGIEGCLPIHIGVDGNPDYLQAVGIAVARDGRDQVVYSIASYFDGWPIYRHWFYVAGLALAVVALFVLAVPAKTRLMGAVLALATCLFYLSFLPTTIACDFRYLYSAIPLVALLWMLLLGHAVKSGPRAGKRTKGAADAA